MKDIHTTNSGFLMLLTVTATLGGFLFGFDTAVISGTISFVKHQYAMDALMEGWYVSSALLGCIGGVAASGTIGNLLGRKITMGLSSLLFIISALGCAFTPSVFLLILFRLVGGLGIGVASVICPMYISEVAPARIRGRLVTYYQLAITLGILAAYFSNSLVLQASADSSAAAWMPILFKHERWRGMFFVGMVPAVLFLLMIFFISESPRWLAMKKRNDEAKKLLALLGSKDSVNTEFAAIQNSLDHSFKTGKGSLWNPVLKKPLLIGMLLAALSQFSGINAIIYYGPSILEKAGFRLSDALGGQVTIGIVNMLFTFVAIYFIDRIGRKSLLMWGIGGAILALLLASIFFASTISNSWLILVPVLLFIGCFAFSFGPVTWVIISEIFPTQWRSKAVAICTMSLWLANWVVGQFFPLLLHHGGPSVTFLVFAVFSVYAFYISWKKIPETKERSLEEIEEFWKQPQEKAKHGQLTAV